CLCQGTQVGSKLPLARGQDPRIGWKITPMHSPRGIAVIDAGATNTKIAVFSHHGVPLAERKIASRHVEGPPYRHIDHEPLAAFCGRALPDLDRLVPLHLVVPCAHGAALAYLASDGSLVLRMMD